MCSLQGLLGRAKAPSVLVGLPLLSLPQIALPVANFDENESRSIHAAESSKWLYVAWKRCKSRSADLCMALTSPTMVVLAAIEEVVRL